MTSLHVGRIFYQEVFGITETIIKLAAISVHLWLISQVIVSYFGIKTKSQTSYEHK